MTAGLTPRPPCRNCSEPRKPRANQPGYKGANGWCEACYKRWLQAGRPPGGPPPPLSPSEKTTKGNNTRRAAKEPGTVNLSLAGQSWPCRAACRDMDTDLWFPVGMAVDPLVLAVCGSCPVQGECLDFAIATGQKGVWGGHDRGRAV